MLGSCAKPQPLGVVTSLEAVSDDCTEQRSVWLLAHSVIEFTARTNLRLIRWVTAL